MYSNSKDVIISTNRQGMKLSLITTVYNEQETIVKFLESVFAQTKLPDEIIIVDGGSTDKTIAAISKSKITNVKVLSKKGNRSVGRNEAIKNAKGDIILCSDAGNILDRRWVENIIKPFGKKEVDVVAGYYKGAVKNIFQKSLVPYVLVMEDKIDENNFLPATRSMAFKKSAWEKCGGFDETLSHNEDYAFANKLKTAGFKIAFAKDAIVNWLPRKNLRQAFIMFFRFALGDAQSKLFREKVLYIFLRYILAFYLILLTGIERSLPLLVFDVLLFATYVAWSVWKNYRYVKNPQAIFYLPLLQFTSDAAVLAGTTLGLVQNFSFGFLFRLALNNKGVASVVLLYIVSMLSVLAYGIPGPSHPFDYFMDEWHQSQSVRNLFAIGTPNVPGAANGSILQFFLTGLYLVPFFLLRIINPFAIKSSVTNLNAQQLLFEVLKLNTLIFGVLSVLVLVYIAKKYFKLNGFLVAFLFVVNPIWLMLSNYFKYDIALIFWSLLSFLFFLRYITKQRFSDYLLAGIFTGLALSTKLLSPLPLLASYILIFFLFTQNFRKKIKALIIGVTGVVITYALFGNPDILLGKGSLFEYVYSNLVQTPAANSSNFILGMDYRQFFLAQLYPAIFGHVFYWLFIVSLVAGSVVVLRKVLTRGFTDFFKEHQLEAVTFLTFILFAASLYLIKVEATNNRVLVLLPFMVIMTALFIKAVISWSKRKVIKALLIAVLIILLGVQLFESYSWFPIKIGSEPRVSSSNWLVQNLQKGTTIGIENIPIYQHLPEVIVKEFYDYQYKVVDNPHFKYAVIDSKSKTLPKTLVITNADLESKYLRSSDKKTLLKRISQENYKQVVVFTPDFKDYKIFNNELEYFISGLVQAPNTISVYEKQ